MKRNVFKTIATLLALVMLSLTIASCGAVPDFESYAPGDDAPDWNGAPPTNGSPSEPELPEGRTTDEGADAPTFAENPFIATQENNISTFSADVDTASYAYFGKHVSELTLAECASLIGITNNPSRYDPYLQLVTIDPETGEEVTNVMRNKRRQETILYEMLDQELISQEEYDEAVAEELVFLRGEDGSRPKKIFSWYEDQVINDVVEDLMEKYL